MKKSKIPKAQKIQKGNPVIKRQQFRYTPSAISFSFEALEWTEYFNLDGTCVNWAFELIEMLKQVSSIQKEDLLNGMYSKSTYRVHDHAKASPPSKLPEGVELKDCYQIRISKSKGGIHGVFYDNIFFVIWLDPLHNMYPADNYGGLRKVKIGSTCCKDRDETIGQLQEENTELREKNTVLCEENKYLESELANI